MRSGLRGMACLLALTAAGSLAVHAQPAARYTVARTGDIVEIADTREQVAASIVTTMSNAYQVRVKGYDVLRKTFASVDDFRAKPGLNGIPLLAPFANRLDDTAFYANGRKYNFDMELGNVRGPIPIHGYLSASKDWRLVEAAADAGSAWITSTLEFYKFPQYMQQFPFAHTLTMTYRLRDGMLEVQIRLDNLGVEPMPVAIGFHPYFQLTDSSREAWTLSVGATTHWKLASTKVPTGETEPIAALLPNPKAVTLKSVDLDDVFTGLEPGAEGRGVVSLKGVRQQLDVLFGPTFKAAVIYSPNPASSPNAAALQAGQGFVAIEPMAGITDSMNLAHKGLYNDLQSIAPGTSWTATFWLRFSGF